MLVLSTNSDYQLIAQHTGLTLTDCCWLLLPHNRQLHLKFADYCVSFLRLMTDIFQPTNTELKVNENIYNWCLTLTRTLRVFPEVSRVSPSLY